MNKRDIKKNRLIILFLAALSLLFCLIVIFFLHGKINRGREEVEILRDTTAEKVETAAYPTNKEELMKKAGSGAYYDENTGLVFKLPSDYTIEKYNGYKLLFNQRFPGSCLILITCGDTRFNSSSDVLLSFSSIKEEVVYRINDKVKKTVLFDTNGGYNVESEGDKEVLITSQKVTLEDNTIIDSSYYHTVIDGKAVCIGTASQKELEQDESLSGQALNMIKSCQPVTFSAKPYLDPTENLRFQEKPIGGIKIEVPDSFEMRKVNSKYTIFRTPPASSDPLQNCVIVFYYDKSFGNSNKFDVIDRSYEISGKVYAAALVRDSSYLPELSEFKMLGSQKEVTYNGKTFKLAKYHFNITPDISGIFSTLPAREVSAKHYAKLMENGETLNIVFFSEPNYSEQSVDILAERMMKTIK